MTLSIISLFAALIINGTRHNNTLPLWWMSLCSVSCFIYCYAGCHYAECRVLLTVMLNVLKLSVVVPKFQPCSRALNKAKVENALAYFAGASMTTKKSFIALVPGWKSSSSSNKLGIQSEKMSTGSLSGSNSTDSFDGTGSKIWRQAEKQFSGEQIFSTDARSFGWKLWRHDAKKFSASKVFRRFLQRRSLTSVSIKLWRQDAKMTSYL